MSKKIAKKCSKSRCEEPAYSMGRCKRHYEEDENERNLRKDAVNALHKGTIDGAAPCGLDLNEQLSKIRKWWFRACDAVNYNRHDPILHDEVQDAVEWCIALAKEIVQAERTIKQGKEPDYMLKHVSNEIYQRFNYLESGLMSNGIEKTKP